MRNDKLVILRKANLDKWKTGLKRCKAQNHLDVLIKECMEKSEYGVGAKPYPHKEILGKAGLSAGSKAIEALLMKKQSKRATTYMEAIGNINGCKVWITSNIAPMIYSRTDDGCVHCQFNIAGTGSGRFSSSEPNVQNLPSKKKNAGKNDVRRCVESRFKDGALIAVDYSQLEIRYVLELVKCRQGIEDYKNGIDLHAATAKAVYDGMHGEGAYDNADDYTKGEFRGKAKGVNFGILYGAFPTDEIGKALYDAFFARYPEVTEWHNKIEDSIMFHSYYEHPLTGWRYSFKGANRDNMYRGFYKDSNGGWRNSARNRPVQGGANEVIQIASIKIDEDIKDRDDILVIAQVHDELLFDCEKKSVDKCLEIAYKHMQDEISQHYKEYFGTELEIPFTVEAEIGDNWFEMKEI